MHYPRNDTAPLPGRREFLTVTTVGGAALLLPVWSAQAQGADAVDVWVLHGADKTALMNAALEVIDANGGFGRNVSNLALKVNAAWARSPELGANTHPELVSTFIRGAKAAGVNTVHVPENSCDRPEQSFARSGIQAAVEEAGGVMYDLKNDTQYFADTPIPQGRTLTRSAIARQFLEADAVVNMPVAKNHRAATLTMCMKNWMGAVQERKTWHNTGLNQCIADFATVMKPTWAIIDATRVMLHRGPKGGRLQFLRQPAPNLLIVSRDQVAADAYATRLFDLEPDDVEYLRIAADMGTGVTDLSRLRIHEVNVPA